MKREKKKNIAHDRKKLCYLLTLPGRFIVSFNVRHCKIEKKLSRLNFYSKKKLKSNDFSMKPEDTITHFQHITAIFSRRKRLTTANVYHSQLRRCLTVIDLTTLGIGSTLGAGIYILAGTVARDLAGPAVIISFLFAGFASLLSGLCYAELGSKYPRAGSAYVYSYVIIGELAAFITGWNLILEYIVGAGENYSFLENAHSLFFINL